MNSKTNESRNGQVFGELKVYGVCNQPLRFLDQEVLINQYKEVFEAKNGQPITLNVHDIFVENENNVSNKANVTFVISIHVQADDEDNALFEANSIFNEETIDFYTFDLETYDHEIYSLNVADFKIEWKEYLEM